MTAECFDKVKQDCNDFIGSFRATLRSAPNIRTLGLTVGTRPLDVWHLGEKLWNSLHPEGANDKMLPVLEALDLNSLIIHMLKFCYSLGMHQKSIRSVHMQ